MSLEFLEDKNEEFKLEGAEKVKDYNRYKNLQRVKDKKHFSTYQSVLDSATLQTIDKLSNRNFFQSFHADQPIASGKESVVFLVSGDENLLAALKIYRVAALKFKHRSKYMTGDYRFRTSYSSSRNHLKLVESWAKKEIINLVKMLRMNINCPRPIHLKRNCLLMQFMGTRNGVAFHKLKDAIDSKFIDDIQIIESLYKQSIVILKRMFSLCNLIHGDFSEYNLMVDPSTNQLIVFDVSQSVEKDHPLAFEFLKRDILNITKFFSRLNCGIDLLKIEDSFDLVTKVYEFPLDKEFDFEEEFDQIFAKNCGNYFEKDLDLKSSQFITTPLISSLNELNVDQIDSEYNDLLQNDEIFNSRLLSNVTESFNSKAENNSEFEMKNKKNEKEKNHRELTNSRKHLRSDEERQKHRQLVKEQKAQKKERKSNNKLLNDKL